MSFFVGRGGGGGEERACTCEETAMYYLLYKTPDKHVCLSVCRASPFGHPTQVSTQVQLAPTCEYLPVRLARALQFILYEHTLRKVR